MSEQNKKQRQAAHQHLTSQGLDPKEIEREQKPELMVPKLALVGIFQTLETFCTAGKTNVMSTVGPLNTRNLFMFLGALKKSLELAEKILMDYQEQQLKTVMQEAADQENNPEEAEGRIKEQNNTETPSEKEESSNTALDIRKLN